MAGKVVTASVSTARYAHADEFWLITRAGPDIPGMVRRRELAPSDALFSIYVDQWKGHPAEEWWALYVQAFSRELGTPEKLGALREVYRSVKTGKVIGLACFCADASCCHRRLVAEFLREHGIEAEEVQPPPDPQLRFDL